MGCFVEPGNATAFTSAILNLYYNRQQLRLLKDNALTPLKKFEPYTQAGMYEHLVIETSKRYDAGKRIYPLYRKGRVLDIAWLPNYLVVSLRKIFRNPKL